MKKTAFVADFTRRFGLITKALAPGESVEVTRFGKVHGRYVREGFPQRRRRLDLGKFLARQDYSEADGQRLIDVILAAV